MILDTDLEDKFKYDGHFCFNLYLLYIEGKATEDDVLTYLKKYIIMMVRSPYSHLGYDVCNDLVQVCLIEVWKLIRKKKLPVLNLKVFHSFLNTIIHRTSCKEFKAVYGPSPADMFFELYDSRYYCRYRTPQDVDDEIFLEELPGVLRKKVSEKLRFQDGVMKDVAQDVLSRLFEGRMIPRDRICYDSKINKRTFDFIIEHIRVLVRSELYKLRDVIDLSGFKDKNSILEDGFCKMEVAHDR
jgi:hypothetical protein